MIAARRLDAFLGIWSYDASARVKPPQLSARRLITSIPCSEYGEIASAAAFCKIEVVRATEMGYNSHRPLSLGQVAAGSRESESRPNRTNPSGCADRTNSTRRVKPNEPKNPMDFND
jgi:hypothetical protein